MLNRALRIAFENLTTFFLLFAVITVPLETANAFFFREVIAVQELHDDIEVLPEGRDVAGVGAQDLLDARAFSWGLSIFESGVALILLGSVARVIAVAEKGGIPTVGDALRHVGDSQDRYRSLRGAPASRWRAVGIAVGLAAFVWWAIVQIGSASIQVLPEEDLWAGVALVRASAWSLAAPLALVPLALMSSEAKGERGQTPTLY